MAPGLHDLFSAATAPDASSALVFLAAHCGETVASASTGVTRRWDAPGVPSVNAGQAVTLSTVFDLASLTKPLVSAALLAELEARGGTPALRVAEVLPEFRHGVFADITVGQLLTHTAGFPSTWADRSPDPGAARFRARSRPAAPPGWMHQYSCVNYIWAGILASELSGLALEALVRRRVCDPLGMHATSYLPPPELRQRVAATEFQRGRGMVQGEVHDETAWALGGVSGNAGVFSTAPDVMRFAEALRTGAGLTPRVHAWLTDPIRGPVTSSARYTPTHGLRSDEPWCAAVPGRTVSHTGFTGTAFLAEPAGSWSMVLLTNRVHPCREQQRVPELRAPIVAATVAARPV